MININTFLGGFIGCLLLEMLAIIVSATVSTIKDRNKNKNIEVKNDGESVK